MEGAEMEQPGGGGADFPGPLRVTIAADGLERSRLTVFFRLILAIPHLIFLALFGMLVFVFAIINWFAVLFTTKPVAADLIEQYLRYGTHVWAYLNLAADRFPEFGGGGHDRYAIDLEIREPEPQNRWSAAFRLILAIPVLLLAGAFTSFAAGYSGGEEAQQTATFSAGVIATAAFLGWFVSLFTARMAEGLRDLIAYAIGYVAQVHSYMLLYTDRYPSADPLAIDYPGEVPEHPVTLSVAGDLERSRLTVFFRLLLAIPHIVWLALWGIAVVFAVIGQWFFTLVAGRPAEPLHRFLSRYLRYSTHVGAFVYLVANPFPGFVGDPGSYPVDVQIGPPQPQHRAKTFFRLPMAIPALAVAGALGGAFFLVAVFGWFTGVFTARMPQGLRNLGVFALRYGTQASAYLMLLTDSYPYASPRLEAGSPPPASASPPSPPAEPQPAA